MTAVLDPSPIDLSRFYDRERPPFRITPKTMLALGIVGGLHLVIGLAIAHAYFAPPPEDKPDKAILVDIPILRPPAPPPKTDHPLPRNETPLPPLTPRPVDAVIPFSVEPLPIPPTTIIADPGPPQPTPVHVDPTPPPKAPPVISNPDWISRPTAAQVGNLYPARALEREIAGKATLLCEVTTTGEVSNCNIVDETPKGYRFGEAAQAMTKYFKLSPRTVDGVSVAGSKVRIPIVFNAT